MCMTAVCVSVDKLYIVYGQQIQQKAVDVTCHQSTALPGLGAVAAAHDNNMGLLSCMLYVQEISAV